MMDVPLTFGPIPSRRLGFSLGVNNIPPKNCSYACVYCQVGRTNPMLVERREFYPADRVAAEVEESLIKARGAGKAVDYVTFVADGEPTLDLALGEEIRRIRRLGVPVAVISNASLIDRAGVREDLAEADWVSLKVDAAGESTWRKIDRPHGRLSLARILEGIVLFASAFGGKLATETMLVAGYNDSEEDLEAAAAFLAGVKPSVAYLSVPTRPPCESTVTPPSPDILARAYRIYAARLAEVEFLTGSEGNDFAALGPAADALLGIVAVHPLRAEAARELLAPGGDPEEILEDLLNKGLLARTAYAGETFYQRKFTPPSPSRPGEGS